MTTDELRDWHARRAGWVPETWPDGNVWWVKRDMDGNARTLGYHPFPPTIDGAASALPPNWAWQRSEGVWWAGQIGHDRWKCVQIPETGIGGEGEIHDRYLLAKLAWEQEQTNDGN